MKKIVLCFFIFYYQFAQAIVYKPFSAIYFFKNFFSPLNCVLVTWHTIKWYKAQNSAMLFDKSKKNLIPSDSSEFTIQYADLAVQRAISTLHAQHALASIISIVLATLGPLLIQRITLLF